MPTANAKESLEIAATSPNNEDSLSSLLQSLELATADDDFHLVQQSALQLLHRLQSNPTSQFLTEVGAAGGCAAVCVALRGSLRAENWSCVDTLLQCIRWLCSYGDTFDTRVDANLALLGACQCNELVVEVLAQCASNVDILQLACICVWQLARSAENSALLGRSGACEAVVRALVEHRSVSGVAQGACAAIWSLTSNNAENKSLLGRCGVCEAVLRALGEHMSVSGVGQWACGAIWTLSLNNAENNALLGRSGACEAVVRALVRHMSVSDVAERARDAIRSLTVMQPS